MPAAMDLSDLAHEFDEIVSIETPGLRYAFATFLIGVGGLAAPAVLLFAARFLLGFTP